MIKSKMLTIRLSEGDKEAILKASATKKISITDLIISALNEAKLLPLVRCPNDKILPTSHGGNE